MFMFDSMKKKLIGAVEDVGFKVTGEFQSLDQFKEMLKPLLTNDPEIIYMCKSLGITEETVNGNTCNDILAEALFVANLGTCIDETLFVVDRLIKGDMADEIPSKIHNQINIMKIFHGLSQGPYQMKHGFEACQEIIYARYGIPKLNEIKGDMFAYTDNVVDFTKYLSAHAAQIIILTIVGKRLDCEGESNHVVAMTVSASGERVSIFDSGKWYNDLKIEDALNRLKVDYPTSNKYQYHSLRLQPIEQKLDIREMPNKLRK